MREMGKLFLTAIVIAAAGVNTEAQAQNPRTIDRRLYLETRSKAK